MGETQGAAQVTVKLSSVMVEGAMSSVKAAMIAELIGASVVGLWFVGPWGVVAGTVSCTAGRDVSNVVPVVNCHTYGLARASPVATLLASVIVTV